MFIYIYVACTGKRALSAPCTKPFSQIVSHIHVYVGVRYYVCYLHTYLVFPSNVCCLPGFLTCSRERIRILSWLPCITHRWEVDPHLSMWLRAGGYIRHVCYLGMAVSAGSASDIFQKSYCADRLVYYRIPWFITTINSHYILAPGNCRFSLFFNLIRSSHKPPHICRPIGPIRKRDYYCKSIVGSLVIPFLRWSSLGPIKTANQIAVMDHSGKM